MQKHTLLILLLFPLFAFSQNPIETDQESIKAVINQFFDSLEKRDSSLLLATAMSDGQVWRVYDEKTTDKIDSRHFSDTAEALESFPDVKEIALDFEINVHHNIAQAWVPYEFFIDDAFSHCGVDVFTLFKVDQDWKIMTIAYSVQKEGCE